MIVEFSTVLCNEPWASMWDFWVACCQMSELPTVAKVWYVKRRRLPTLSAYNTTVTAQYTVIPANYQTFGIFLAWKVGLPLLFHSEIFADFPLLTHFWRNANHYIDHYNDFCHTFSPWACNELPLGEVHCCMYSLPLLPSIYHLTLGLSAILPKHGCHFKQLLI